jgi:hypothetical protein
VEFSAALVWLQDWTALLFHYTAVPIAFVGRWIDHPVVRSIGLVLLVLATIRWMGVIYGGKVQNAFYGPVAIRAHSNSGLRRQDIRLPKALVDMSLDGVHADCEVYYAYTDWRGKRRKVRVGRIGQSVINVVPSALPAVQNMVDGQEISGRIADLHFVDVVIPVPEADPAINVVLPTPERVGDYIRENKVLESWTDDDTAVRISLHADELRNIIAAREDFIVAGAERVRAAREGNWWARLSRSRLAQKRPGVIGSYYLRFRHSMNPIDILTRHPDRDLKMTAWLTLLTSLFAMVMEAWPMRSAPMPVDGVAQTAQHGSDAIRTPTRVP